MQFSEPVYPTKRKNAAGLSPEVKQWLRAILLISILPGTLLVIGLLLWLSLSF